MLPQDEILLVLMKLRLNLLDEDLAFRYTISTKAVSTIIATLIPFLSYELCILIHWPSPDEILRHTPQCFEKHGNVKAVIDCTGVQTQRPSQTDIIAKLYSDYKQRLTYKVLVACTPGGTVSFVSKAVGGNMSDMDLVCQSGFLSLLQKGDVIIANKGFRDQSDFIKHGAKLIIPKISRKGVTLTGQHEECCRFQCPNSCGTCHWKNERVQNSKKRRHSSYMHLSC
jgi:hypothetical protein